MGQDTTADASRALRLLNSEDLRHHPRTAPAERHTPAAVPGTPLNLALVDYLADTVADVTTHVRAIAPQAGPAPRQVEGIYDWYVQQTGDADQDQQTFRDITIERHRLEHAIRLGEYDVVCKEPCPRCGRWGLMWQAGWARCSHTKCRTPDGMHSTFTLARLATQKIRRTEIWRANAT